MKFNIIHTFCETYQQVPKDVCLVKLKIYIKTKCYVLLMMNIFVKI